MTLQIPERPTDSRPPQSDASQSIAAAMAPDSPLIVIIVTLLGLGLFMVFSASFPTQGTDFFLKQIAWIALSVVACGAMTIIPYSLWRQLAIPIMIMTIVVLAAVLVFGKED